MFGVLATWVWFNRTTEQEIAEWILRAGGTVEFETDFGQVSFFDTVDGPAGDLPVVAVDLTGASVESIGKVARLLHLRWLSVDGIPVGKSELARITRLDNLTELHLTMCSLRDEDLTVLFDMQGLESLDLSDNEITDEGARTHR